MINHSVPDWRDPLLVAAFGGWGDAAGVATTCSSFLLKGRDVRTVVDFDPEELFVLSETRPRVQVSESGQRTVHWPSISLMSARGEPRDLAVLMGPEPQLRWRTFAQQVRDFWIQNGSAGPVLLFGAFLAGVAHTSSVVCTGFANKRDLRTQLVDMGVHPSGYRGPTSIHSILMDAFDKEGVPCVSIWAAVPHYLASMPNPKAALALLNHAGQLFDLQLDLREMEEATRTFETQIDSAIAKTGTTVSFGQPEIVQESRSSRDESANSGPLPPAEDLVKGVEEFLRQRRPDQ